MGCRVEDNVYPMLPDRANYALLIGDRRKDRNGSYIFLRSQFHLDLVKGKFVGLKEHQALRTPLGNLATQFRTNRSTGSSDHYGAAHNHLANEVRIRRDRRPAQQFVDLDLVDLAHKIFAGDKIGDARQRLYLDPVSADITNNLFPARSRNRGYRQDDLLDPVIAHKGREVGRRKDLDACDVPAMERRIIVKKPCDKMAVAQRCGQLAAGFTSTVNDNRRAIEQGFAARGPEYPLSDQSASRDHQRAKRPINDWD